jgi:hypothetical protein
VNKNKAVETILLVLHVKLFVSFSRYCDHTLSEELNKTVVLMMEDLVRFQDRQHFKDPVKAKTKRRYVAGMREIKKFLTVKKISALLIAPGWHFTYLHLYFLISKRFRYFCQHLIIFVR